MDPINEKVNVEVIDYNMINDGLWGLGFIDIADEVEYNMNPIGIDSDYSITSIDDISCNSSSNILNEISLISGNNCNAKSAINGTGVNYISCFKKLPNNKNITLSVSEINNIIYIYNFELDFKSCGYEFNPYEYQTCRPFTLTNIIIDNKCLLYVINSIQIYDYPTNIPTSSPSFEPTLFPTINPTPGPTFSPTSAPVHPTISPTLPSNSPSSSPTSTPTAKPTRLPTSTSFVFDKPECRGLQIKHLDVLYPLKQSNEEFNQIFINYDTFDPLIHNERRVWSNGYLQIYFSNRFNSIGDWIINNGSYFATSLTDPNFNNSLVNNISLPGPYPQGFIYYDHFPNDNIFAKPDQVTLFFKCNDSLYPSIAPTNQPNISQPTLSPITFEPTMAPTANCTGLCIETINDDSCFGNIGNLFKGCYLRQDDLNLHPTWIGVADVTGYLIYFSTSINGWIIEGNDGYSASTTQYNNRYPPGLNLNGISNDNSIEWIVFDQTNTLNLHCHIYFEYVCYGTGIPTKSPTPSPTTAMPTSGTPTISPTATPSMAPVNNPTFSPSLAPSLAPTGAPTSDCNGLFLSGTDSNLDGLYRKEDNTSIDYKIANKNVWKKVRGGDGLIFWSDSAQHESWIINSEQLGQYWLSLNKPNGQPPIYGQWQLYIGSLPFVENTKILTFICYGTLPPTPEPTPAPTIAPTNSPTNIPSNAPSLTPTHTPSLAPTISPTPSPTTLSPTLYPTLQPTFDPTQEPTPEACQFLLISNPNKNNETEQYIGIYEYKPFYSAWWKQEINGYYYELKRSLSDGQWQIGNTIPENEDFIKVDGNILRPPYHATTWKFIEGGISNTNFTLNIDCSNTTSPTYYPTNAPSLSPTNAPTSSCMGLLFINQNNENFKYNGWFQRQNDFEINNHKYWISVDSKATIEYIQGFWYLMEKDNDKLNDDEDPIMLTKDGSNLLSPPSGEWIYTDTSLIDKSVMITIICDATFAPSLNPSKSPTNHPTNYVEPTFAFCPNLTPYFTFLSNISSAVYWPEPELNDHLYSINMTSDYISGDNIPIGINIIEYIATDSKGTEIQCNITIIVIEGSKYKTGYEYCKKELFHIEVKFNTTYYIFNVNEQDIETIQIIKEYDGIIYDPNLEKNNQNCYVTAQQISSYQAINIENEPEQSSFFGFEAINLIWEILILLLIILLICLCFECSYRRYRDRKDAQNAKDDAQTEKLLANHDETDEKSQEEKQTEVELQEPVQEPVAND